MNEELYTVTANVKLVGFHYIFPNRYDKLSNKYIYIKDQDIYKRQLMW